jgi:hypothetical protein
MSESVLATPIQSWLCREIVAVLRCEAQKMHINLSGWMLNFSPGIKGKKIKFGRNRMCWFQIESDSRSEGCDIRLVFHCAGDFKLLGEEWGFSFAKWPIKFVMNLKRMTGMILKGNEWRDGQIGRAKWIKRSYFLIVSPERSEAVIWM